MAVRGTALCDYDAGKKNDDADLRQTGNDVNITSWVNPNDKSGEFKRGQSAFRNWISSKPGAQFPPEKDRYHLYVSYACPWGELVYRFKSHNTLVLTVCSSQNPYHEEVEGVGRYHSLHGRPLAYGREGMAIRYP